MELRETFRNTAVGPVPVVSTRLRLTDRLGAWGVRWHVGRLRYRVAPGLYAVGSPTERSEVFVSANYKLSFDALRAALAGIDGWILVLDTRGINVWCAAGKGTFGTDEIVRRIHESRLSALVRHRRIIVPQLGAPGTCAHAVKEQSGFRVVYGPVRATDIPRFVAARFKATPAMRRVDFTLGDRLALIPSEIVGTAKYGLTAAVLVPLLVSFATGSFAWNRLYGPIAAQIALLLLVWLGAVALPPALLPWLPGRALAVKGMWVGLALGGLCAWHIWADPGPLQPFLGAAASFLFLPALASFLALNFTGSCSYTSLSGVLKEMRIALPLQIAGAVAGIALFVTGCLI